MSAGLFAVVAAAADATVVGQQDVAGLPATHVRASAQPQAAVEAGLGTQAQLVIAELPELPVEVWVDEAGRPVRIRYVVTLPSHQAAVPAPWSRPTTAPTGVSPWT